MSTFSVERRDKSLSDKEVLERWEAYRLSLNRDAAPPLAETEADKRARIKRLLGNFAEFCQYYFPRFASSPFAPFHLRFARKIERAERLYIVRAWARDHGKSVTAGLFVPIFEMMNGRLKNMLLVSHSYDNAEKLLMPIMLHLESNQRLLNDFGVQKGYRGWEVGDFSTAKGVAFKAVGAGQSPRGTRKDETRPDYILVDDIDTDEECRNEARIKQKWDWIEQALLPTVSVDKRFRLVFVGNLIAKNGCIARAAEKADDYEAINILDKTGKPSWSGRYTVEQVNYMLSKISYISGQKEYFNNPITEGSVFKEMHWGKVPPLKNFAFLCCYTDPSYKASERSDYKGTVLVGELDGTFYIITGFLEQTTTSALIEWHYAIDQRVNGATSVYYYIEQNLNADDIRNDFHEAAKAGRKALSVSFDDRKKPEKFTRIESTLEPLNTQRRLILNEAERDNPHLKRLEEQFKALEPKLSGHDDGPDAVEGAVWIINNKLRVFAPVKVGNYRRHTKRY